jgi:ATPase family associated with various cellular activities (AAA)
MATRTRRRARPAPSPSAPPPAAADEPHDHAAWFAANRQALDAALAALRAALEARAGSPGATAATPMTDDVVAPPAMTRLATLFELSPFECGVMLLCLAYELDAGFGPLYAALQGDRARAYPTFALALALFPGGHWDAVTPVGRLRRWRLIELVGEGALMVSRIALDERVVHYVAGAAYLDRRLAGLVVPVTDAPDPAGETPAAARIITLWRRATGAAGCPVVELSAADAATSRSVTAAACAALGLALHEVRAADLPRGIAEREPLQRLWAREALLAHSALFIEAHDVDPGEVADTLALFVETLPGLVVVGTRAPLLRLRRACERVDLPSPASAEQLAAWRRALGPLAERLNGQLEALAGQFRLAPRDIAVAGRRALERAGGDGEHGLGRRLWSACREQARAGLQQLAERIDSQAGWDDLVLPAAQLGSLQLIGLHVQHRTTVYERWGLGQRGARGLGVSALFVGPSGTGKTLAAEVLARELGLDLYRIDLSMLVSKYVGETEKNLKRVFDAADASGAILLFDEADALFGRRSEVKDSHDRYANIEVSYLLQKVDSYRGLAILTTNLKEVIDPAFLRRIRFVVHFPFPDAEQRREIWRRMLPRSLPRDRIDLERLARLDLVGGNIRNLAVNAAFLAAHAAQPLRMEHLRVAAEAEYAKLEKPLLDSEIGDWA